MQARNAHFNLNRLGVVAREYGENFYGTDYVTDPEQRSLGAQGLGSDRLIANWELEAPRVIELSRGAPAVAPSDPVAMIEIPADWINLLRHDVDAAKREQLRVRSEFSQAFAKGLICAGFKSSPGPPQYLLYQNA
jgi:predicted GNAT superfamily acetyltransferase